MKKLFMEFKKFALRGKVMDLAVGVIIGAAFQGVVAALTENILNPVIGIFSGVDFSQSLKVTLPFTAATINFGAFIAALINFFIMAFIIFILVKGMNKLADLGKTDEAAPPDTKKCPYCCSDIPLKATRCPCCTTQLE